MPPRYSAAYGLFQSMPVLSMTTSSGLKEATHSAIARPAVTLESAKLAQLNVTITVAVFVQHAHRDLGLVHIQPGHTPLQWLQFHAALRNRVMQQTHSGCDPCVHHERQAPWPDDNALCSEAVRGSGQGSRVTLGNGMDSPKTRPTSTRCMAHQALSLSGVVTAPP
jgi:hypothetical protein